MKFAAIITTLSLLSLTFLWAVRAQGIANVSLSAIPASPTEGEMVSVAALPFGFDPTRSAFQWFRDGALQGTASGIGNDVFRFAAGPLGTTTKIRVLVKTEQNETASAEVSITTQELLLSWEANTFVPPTYAGRALPVAKSFVRVFPAITPRTAKGQTLFYRWFLDDEAVLSASGVNRSSFVFRPTLAIGDAHTVRLELSTPDGTIFARAQTTVPVRSPEVFLYPLRNPERLLPAEQSVDALELAPGEKISLLAVPYFFSVSDLASLSFTWRLEGEVLPATSVRPNAILITAPPDIRRGAALDLFLSVVKNGDPLERAGKVIPLRIK
ncbi:hypothetical protein HYW30_00980 [Candidatus Azambacteria bacterium]|nr:hypothetical protein [Candidatus Azambacteria bacterium]MBI2587862.1 hypothetical protein [Candidatus Azambacteria bacterium]